MPMKKKTATTTKKTSSVNTQGMDPEFISLLNAIKPLDDIVEWDEILEGMVPNYTYHFIENTARYIIATALDDPDIEISSAVREDDKELAYIFGYNGCECNLIVKTTGIRLCAMYGSGEFDTHYYDEYASVKTIAEIKKTLDNLTEKVIRKTILDAAKQHGLKLK